MSNLTKEQMTVIQNINDYLESESRAWQLLNELERVFPFLVDFFDTEPVLTERWHIEDIQVAMENHEYEDIITEKVKNNDMDFFREMFEYLSTKLFNAEVGWNWDSLSFGVISYLDTLELNDIEA